jgi:hypothetical protein
MCCAVLCGVVSPRTGADAGLAQSFVYHRLIEATGIHPYTNVFDGPDPKLEAQFQVCAHTITNTHV